MPVEAIEAIGAWGGLVILGTMSLIGMRIWLGHKRERLRLGDPGERDRLAESVANLHDQVRLLREEMGEVHERLDFAERLLTRGREPRSSGEPADTPG